MPASDRSSLLLSAPALFVAALLLLFTGVALGTVLSTPTPSVAAGAVNQSETAPGQGRLLAELDQLSQDIEQLALREDRLVSPPNEPSRVAAPPGADSEEQALALDSLQGVARQLDRLEVMVERIDDRLAGLEARNQLWVADAAADASARSLEIAVPPGTSSREYLAALKDWIDGAEVARAHRFWSTDRIVAVYGQPDEIVDEDDYIEWKYYLSESGEQFDFHFVGGLCVQAH